MRHVVTGTFHVIVQLQSQVIFHLTNITATCPPSIAFIKVNTSTGIINKLIFFPFLFIIERLSRTQKHFNVGNIFENVRRLSIQNVSRIFHSLSFFNCCTRFGMDLKFCWLTGYPGCHIFHSNCKYLKQIHCNGNK